MNKNEELLNISDHWQLFTLGKEQGVRGIGRTLEQAFENVGKALTTMVTTLDSVKPKKSIPVVCSAPDLDLLLLDWVNVIINEMNLRKMLFSKFEVTITECSLEAVLTGESVDQERHLPAVEPKGATFTELKVKQLPNGFWLAQCVVDL